MFKSVFSRILNNYNFLKVLHREQDNERLNKAGFLMNKYADLISKDQKSQFRKEEYRVFSQNGEDGLLLYIFSTIGTTNKCLVEFGVGDTRQCNGSNLLLNFGWNALFIEGDEESYKKGLEFQRAYNIQNVTSINSFITTENINSIISDGGMSGEIDLLSIDIDGNDYWVWEAINVINPRVVVIEYNSTFGIEKSVTIPYQADFERWSKHPSGYYHGASLKALVKLGQNKGYKLVACDSMGVNAFFIRNDIAKFEEQQPEDAYYHNLKKAKQISSQPKQLELIQDLPLQEV